MASGDLTDLATAKIAANVPVASAAETDQILAALISAISAYVPNVLNRHILADNYLETYRGNGKDQMLLRERPVLLVSSVSWRGQIISTQIDPIASSGSGIWTDGRNACLAGVCFPRGETIRIAYSAGYVDAPLDLSLAVAELVAEAYSRRTHVGETSRSQNGQTTISFDPKSMHNAIADKLSSYARGAPC